MYFLGLGYMVTVTSVALDAPSSERGWDPMGVSTCGPSPTTIPPGRNNN